MKDGYDDDDFEDYQEEFEEFEDDSDDKISNSPPDYAKITPKPDESKQANHLRNDSAPVVAQEKIESKQTLSLLKTKAAPIQSKNDITNVKKTAPTQSWTDNIKLGPQKQRIDKIFMSKVLDLQEEKFTQLNILPSTLSDLYYRKLRGGDTTLTSTPGLGNNNNNKFTTSQYGVTNSTTTTTSTDISTGIRQIGTSMREDMRDMEVNTDDIIMIDQEMQFVYGADDIQFLHTLNTIQNKSKSISTSTTTTRKSEKQINQSMNSLYTRNSSYNNNNSSKENPFQTSTNLLQFLHYSTNLFESILSYQNSTSTDNTNSTITQQMNTATATSLLDINGNNSNSIILGEPERHTMNELIVNRTIIAISCSSTINVSWIITAHPYPIRQEDIDTDLRPYKGIYCIWNIVTPSVPIFILESAGQPTTCTFSATQGHIVVAGSEEGNICMWDLTESNQYHIDKDSIDLKIDKGIRKPCYTSTTLSHMTQQLFDQDTILNDNQVNGKNTGSNTISDTINPVIKDNTNSSYHYARILQIESLKSDIHSSSSSSTTTSSSQFVSLDSEGVIIFWITKSILNSTNLSTNKTNNLSLDIDSDNIYDMAPWSKIKLISTHRIHIHTLPTSTLSKRLIMSNTTMDTDTKKGNKTKSSTDTNNSISVTSKDNNTVQSNSIMSFFQDKKKSNLKLSYNYMIQTVSGNVSTIYVTGGKLTGLLYKIDRYTGQYTIFQMNSMMSNLMSKTLLDNSSILESSIMSHLASITTIAIRQNYQNTHMKVPVTTTTNKTEDESKTYYESKDNDNKQTQKSLSSSSSTTSSNNSNKNVPKWLHEGQYILIGYDNGIVQLIADITTANTSVSTTTSTNIVNDENSISKSYSKGGGSLSTTHYCLLSWNIAHMNANKTKSLRQNNTMSSTNSSSSTSSSNHNNASTYISYIRWIDMHPASFYIITLTGMMYYFNLLIDPYQPILCEQLPSSIYTTCFNNNNNNNNNTSSNSGNSGGIIQDIEEFLLYRYLYHIQSKSLNSWLNNSLSTPINTKTNKNNFQKYRNTLYYPIQNKYKMNVIQVYDISPQCVSLCSTPEEWTIENNKFIYSILTWIRQ